MRMSVLRRRQPIPKLVTVYGIAIVAYRAGKETDDGAARWIIISTLDNSLTAELQSSFCVLHKSCIKLTKRGGTVI